MFFEIIKAKEAFFMSYSISLVVILICAYVLNRRLNPNTELYERPRAAMYIFIGVQLLVLLGLFLSVEYNMFAIVYFSPFVILFLLSFFYFVDSIIFYNDYDSKGTFTYFLFKAALFFGYGIAGIYQMNNLVGGV